MARGVFITIEGADGCGKSTQAKLLAERLEACGREVVSVREPGGTAISEKIRALLLDPANAEMCPECELMLFEASRAQLVRTVIEPALERGAVVVCDRYTDSTFAYQAAGRDLARDTIHAANALGSCGRVPDRTVLLDMETGAALGRAVAASGKADRMEAEGVAFQQRVREGYLELAAADPGRVRKIDAAGTPEEVAAAVFAQVEDLLGETGAGAASNAAAAPAPTATPKGRA